MFSRGKECNTLKLNKFLLFKGEKKINVSRYYEEGESDGEGKSWSQRSLRPIESLAQSYRVEQWQRSKSMITCLKILLMVSGKEIWSSKGKARRMLQLLRSEIIQSFED